MEGINLFPKQATMSSIIESDSLSLNNILKDGGDNRSLLCTSTRRPRGWYRCSRIASHMIHHAGQIRLTMLSRK